MLILENLKFLLKILFLKNRSCTQLDLKNVQYLYANYVHLHQCIQRHLHHQEAQYFLLS